MKQEKNRKRVAFLQLFCIFFLLIAFVLTSSMALFMTYLHDATHIDFTAKNIGAAATVTFGNVFMLSLVCAAVDLLRRRLTVERPVKRIIDGAQKVMDGDLSTRIAPLRGVEPGFSVIIDYFNRMVQELSGMETLRADFIANVSHELKTPLAVIQNYGAMLQQLNLSYEDRKDLRPHGDERLSATCQSNHQHPQAQQAGKPTDLSEEGALRPGRAALRMPARV